MLARRTERRRDSGFAVLQIVIVASIACIVAAVAIPVYAARAKESVLQQNARTLEMEVKSYLALDLDPVFVAGPHSSADDGEGDKRPASEVIARALGGQGGGISAYYVNPLCGSRDVVCQSALPETAGGEPPAVWITDDQRYEYGAFAASPVTKSRLRGTLMIVFATSGGRTSGIEVFYVDAAGEKSPSATTLAI